MVDGIYSRKYNRINAKVTSEKEREMEKFKTIEKEAEGIIIEKKSKFITNIFYVENEREAEEILNKIRKKYHDARHHCFAYRINTERGIEQKQSDDGEPSGTAGAPMLNILEKRELVNIIAITTRYFGGILLGTGGLVKAYSDSLKEALQNAKEEFMEEGYVVEMIFDYSESSKIEHICAKENISVVEKEYGEKIRMVIEIENEKFEKIVEKRIKNDYQNITTKIINKKYIKSNILS